MRHMIFLSFQFPKRKGSPPFKLRPFGDRLIIDQVPLVEAGMTAAGTEC
jgi:hypothetical protein